MTIVLLQNWLYSLIDFLGMTIITYKLLGRPWKWERRCLAVPMFAFIVAAIGLLPYLNVVKVVQLASSLGFIYVLFRPKIKELPFIYMMDLVVMAMIQITLLAPLLLIFGKVENNFTTAVTAQSMALACYILVYKYVPINRLYRFAQERNRTFLILLLNLFIITVFLLLYWLNDFSGLMENALIMTMFTALMIGLNMVILRNGLKNEVAFNQLKMHEQYMPIVNDLIHEIRSRQHDFNNHLQALRMIGATAANQDEAREKMDDYLDAMTTQDQLRELLIFDNKLLAGFLYSKYTQALEKGIEIRFDLPSGDFSTKLYDYEWIELLGVLIDNAMETGVADNAIEVVLKKEKDMNQLVVRNKHPYLEHKTIKAMFAKGSSSKAETGRGYGLFNVNRLVNKYRGQINVQNLSETPQNYVEFSVVLP